MKHSNWILAIGVIVAVILIAGSIFLNTKARVTNGVPVVNTPTAIKGSPVKKVIMTTFKEVSSRIPYLSD